MNQRREMILAWIAAIIVTLGFLSFLGAFRAYPHDNGQFAQADPGIRSWFNGLRSGKGLCCSFADGLTLQDVDWDTEGAHYRVRIDGQWIVVPDDAVLTEPNRVGVAVVWPYKSGDQTMIRCFIAGSGT